MSNLLSFSSVKLELLSKDGHRLNAASGFIVEAGKRYFLITNRHVVMGEDFHTNGPQEPVIKPCFLKTSVHLHGFTSEKGDVLSRGIRKRITIPLYGEDDSPRWVERRHEGHEHRADVVALPIHINLTLKFFGAEIPGITMKKSSWDEYADVWTKVSSIHISTIDADIEYGPPDTVHVVGYPLGWAPDGTDRTSSAFWRTSFIASEIYEPGMRRADGFFIDPSAPEGMTGSPVAGLKNDQLKLLGVYSDRSIVEFGANAGFVYGAWLIKELIRAS